MFGFAVRAVAWSLALFAALRLPWIDLHAVLPVTQWQGRAADALFGASPHAVQVTSACSGADALALCAGAILGYPAMWSRRRAGVAGAVVLLLAANIVRIATLGRAAGSPRLFETLHLYVWPGVFTLAIAIYVFTWMHLVERRASGAVAVTALAAEPSHAPLRVSSRTRRFAWVTVVLLVLCVGLSPGLADNSVVLAIAAFIARAAAFVLLSLGLQAGATTNVLWTAHGGFLVTSECIVTPLIAVYWGAVIAYIRRWPVAVLALMAAVPLFTALGVARLLVVALPAGLAASPLFFVHAFYQLVAAAALVFVAARWRQASAPRVWRRWAAGCAVGVVLTYVSAPLYAQTGAIAGAPVAAAADAQGAIAFVPSFQVGLTCALAVAASVNAWRSRMMAVGLLAGTQVAFFLAIGIAGRYGLEPHARDVRAWALLIPVLIVIGLVARERSRP